MKRQGGHRGGEKRRANSDAGGARGAERGAAAGPRGHVPDQSGRRRHRIGRTLRAGATRGRLAAGTLRAMRISLATAVCSALALAVPAFAAGPLATLRLVTTQPLVARGLHFKPYERVRVTERLATDRAFKLVRA